MDQQGRAGGMARGVSDTEDLGVPCGHTQIVLFISVKRRMTSKKGLKCL